MASRSGNMVGWALVFMAVGNIIEMVMWGVDWKRGFDVGPTSIQGVLVRNAIFAALGLFVGWLSMRKPRRKG